MATLLVSCAGRDAGSGDRSVNDVPTRPEVRQQSDELTTILPEEFIAKFVVSDGVHEEVSAIARKGERVRWDFNWYPNKPMTWLNTDQIYRLDHSAHTYTPIPRRLLGAEPGDELERLFGPWPETMLFFRVQSLKELQLVDQLETSTVYGRGVSTHFDYQLITVDNASGMIIKIEYPKLKGQHEQGSLVQYKSELRDLEFHVDDSIFEIPLGYTETSVE